MRTFTTTAAVAAVILPLSAVAGADEPPARAAESALHEDELGVSLRPGLAGTFSWSAHALALAGSDHGVATTGLGAGAAIAWDVDHCRLLDLGAHATVSLAPDGSAHDVSGEHWLSACLVSGDVLPSVRIGHRLELSVTPALAAPRRTLALPYSAETFFFAMTMMDLPLGDWGGEPGARLAFFRVTPSVAWVRQAPEGTPHDHFETRVDVDIASYTAPRPLSDLGFDILHVELRSVTDRFDTTVMTLAPLRLSGVRAGGLLVDTWLGWSHASSYDPELPPPPPDQVATPLVEDDLVAGRVAVRGGSRKLSLGVELDRGAWPALGDEIVVETRGGAWASGQRGRLAWSARGFVARTVATPVQGEARADATGGGEVRVAWHLGRGFQAAVTGEAARSFYAATRAEDGAASLARTDAAAPAWGVRGLGVISAQWGSK